MDETRLLYLDDAYLKEFDARVLSVIEHENLIYVVLDQTLFYPRGGGQPSDTGVLECLNISCSDTSDTVILDIIPDIMRDRVTSNDLLYNVLEVIKLEGRILHRLDKSGLKSGDNIKGKIDWDRRHMLMCMHTASHLLDAVLYKDGKIMVTGNELGIDKSRIDFNMPEFNMDRVQEYVNEANKIISKDLPVKNYYLSKEEAFKIPGIVKLAGALPPDIPLLRITEIVGLDIQADGGTHVNSLKEIGKINILSIENKGKERKRICYTLLR